MFSQVSARAGSERAGCSDHGRAVGIGSDMCAYLI